MLIEIPDKDKPLKFVGIMLLIALMWAGINLYGGYCIAGPFGECTDDYNLLIGFANATSRLGVYIVVGTIVATVFGKNKSQ